MPKCPTCDTLVPENKVRCPICKNFLQFGKSSTATAEDDFDTSVPLSDVKSSKKDRIDVGVYNPIFGGGLVKTSVVMLGGSPGAGKTTWLLQLSDLILDKLPERQSLYVAAEQCLSEVKEVGERLELKNLNRLRGIDALQGMHNLPAIMEKHKPCLTVIDSVQRFCGLDQQAQNELCKGAKDLAVQFKMPVILVSHVTKEEQYAGANTNLHDIDTALMLNNDENDVRYLSSDKNRNGATNFGLYLKMTGLGLVVIDEPESSE